MDSIFISNLIVHANHGVFQEEKNLGQKFLIDLTLNLDTQEAGITENLEKSVHYGVLANEVTELFKSKSNDLIEKCAEEIAVFILTKYDLVKNVNVKIKKPWAPIMLPVDEVLVEINRKRHIAFLGLGSNIGDSEIILKNAIQKINNEYTKVTKKSKLYRTKAWGLEEQPDFLNMAIEIETFYEPLTLLKHLQKIEIDLGRERKIHWGPRTIDIDILFIDNLKIYAENLKVPHPYIEERQFVLEPMCDIAPFYVHPVLNTQIRKLLEKIKGND